MRHADRPETDVQVDIDAPPGVVWALVSDVAVPARFSEELQDVRWLDGADGPALGARFLGHNRREARDGAIEWHTTSTVTALEPERCFEWTVEDLDDPVACWRFELEPAPGGGTVLRLWAKVGSGRSGLTMAIDRRPELEERIVAGRLEEWRANMTATVEGIKAVAEGGG